MSGRSVGVESKSSSVRTLRIKYATNLQAIRSVVVNGHVTVGTAVTFNTSYLGTRPCIISYIKAVIICSVYSYFFP